MSLLPLFGFWNHFVSMYTQNIGKRPHMSCLRGQWQIVQAYKKRGNCVLDADATDFTIWYCENMHREYRDLGVDFYYSPWNNKS